MNKVILMEQFQDKQVGEEFPYVRNGHSGYQVKWHEDILSQLQELAVN